MCIGNFLIFVVCVTAAAVQEGNCLVHHMHWIRARARSPVGASHTLGGDVYPELCDGCANDGLWDMKFLEAGDRLPVTQVANGRVYRGFAR